MVRGHLLDHDIRLTHAFRAFVSSVSKGFAAGHIAAPSTVELADFVRPVSRDACVYGVIAARLLRAPAASEYDALVRLRIYAPAHCHVPPHVEMARGVRTDLGRLETEVPSEPKETTEAPGRWITWRRSLGERDRAESGREAVEEEAVELPPAICMCAALGRVRGLQQRVTDFARTNSASISWKATATGPVGSMKTRREAVWKGRRSMAA